jgi:hypothetical protein
MPSIDNRYVPGSGVGASSVASRRAKLIRSTNCVCINRSRLGLLQNAPTPNPSLNVPSPPTDVTLTNVSPDVVAVYFDPPESTGGSPILSYRIICVAVGRPDIIIAPITTTSLTNEITLPQGVSYTVTVIATNAVGNSSAASATPPSITPLSNEEPTIVPIVVIESSPL